MDGRHGVGFGGQDRQAGKIQFGAKKMAERGKDLIGLASTLNGLGEIEQAINGCGSLGQNSSGGFLCLEWAG